MLKVEVVRTLFNSGIESATYQLQQPVESNLVNSKYPHEMRTQSLLSLAQQAAAAHCGMCTETSCVKSKLFH